MNYSACATPPKSNFQRFDRIAPRDGVYRAPITGTVWKFERDNGNATCGWEISLPNPEKEESAQIMKKIFMLLGICANAVLVAEGEPFSRIVGPEEFSSAGLAKLSPSELARLDGLFTKYSAAQIPAPAKPQNQMASTAPVLVRPATPKPGPAADTEGLVARAKKIFSEPKGRSNPQAMEGQIDGSFEGWSRNTVWKLKDGTRWQAENNQPGSISRSVRDPKVIIYPAAINGFWLELPELDQKVRVRQLP